MNVLLVLTAGQADVQLVAEGRRAELRKDRCARLHAELEQRDSDWRVVDAPAIKAPNYVEALPVGSFNICTPKLDAVLDDLEAKGLRGTHALILETRRDPDSERGDPRAAGLVLARRLRERLGESLEIERTPILQGSERLEDRSSPRDAVVRREVVTCLDQAIRGATAKIDDGLVVVATTGGMPVVAALAEEVVRLHVDVGTTVELVEVADGAKAKPPTRDHAVARRSVPEPAESYRARRHALDLIEGGNLLAAWGVARHLHSDEVEVRWTRVVEWLSRFATSLPIPAECDLPLLRHPRMAVRAALRVELALRAGDITRAVHGTMAFFEAAFWDWLREYDFGKEGITKPSDTTYQLPPKPSADQRKRFTMRREVWRINDFPKGIHAWLPVLNKPGLSAFWKAMADDIRDLRNDVAHNEPTPELIENARHKIADVGLWSSDDQFLAQELVRNVLVELGEASPERLREDLVATVKERLRTL